MFAFSGKLLVSFGAFNLKYGSFQMASGRHFIRTQTPGCYNMNYLLCCVSLCVTALVIVGCSFEFHLIGTKRCSNTKNYNDMRHLRLYS